MSHQTAFSHRANRTLHTVTLQADADRSHAIPVTARPPDRDTRWWRLLRPEVFVRVIYRSTAVTIVLACAVVAYTTRRFTPLEAQRLGRRVAVRILRIARVTVEQQGKADPEPGLTVCNHRSYIDILALMCATPCTFLCKKEVGRWPLIGTIAKSLGVVFVDRRSSQSRQESLARVARAVLSGRRVTAFPEGTTTRGPGMGKPRPGLFRAAEQHDFPILPVVIEYADPNDAWVGDDTLLRHVLFWLAKPSGHVTVRFGKALRRLDDPEGSLQERTESWMRSALSQLNLDPDERVWLQPMR